MRDPGKAEIFSHKGGKLRQRPALCESLTHVKMGESRRFSTRPSTGFVNCLKPAGCAELQGLDQDDLIWLLSYRPGAEEAGPEKSFDLSEVAMAQRWRAGFLDMQHAAGLAPDKNGICSVRRR